MAQAFIHSLNSFDQIRSISTFDKLNFSVKMKTFLKLYLSYETLLADQQLWPAKNKTKHTNSNQKP